MVFRSLESDDLFHFTPLSPFSMSLCHIRIDYFLITIISIALLLTLRKTFRIKSKKLRKLLKLYLPRKWKPRSPKDCPGCRSGITLAVLKPNTDVIPYAQRKSTRGRTKQLETQGHACPNPKCDYFGVTDDRLHAIVGDGKRGIHKHIQYWKCQWCQQAFHQSPAHPSLST